MLDDFSIVLNDGASIEGGIRCCKNMSANPILVQLH